MQCVDCHFESDAHGNGHLYGATRDAITEDCVDCHGTVEKPAMLLRYLSEDGGADAYSQSQASLASRQKALDTAQTRLKDAVAAKRPAAQITTLTRAVTTAQRALDRAKTSAMNISTSGRAPAPMVRPTNGT